MKYFSSPNSSPCSLSLVSSHERTGTSKIAYFSARLPDGTTKCGKQTPITGGGAGDPGDVFRLH